MIEINNNPQTTITPAKEEHPRQSSFLETDLAPPSLLEVKEVETTQVEVVSRRDPLPNHSSKPNLILGARGRLVNANTLQAYAPPVAQGPGHVPVHPFELYRKLRSELEYNQWNVEEEFLAMDDDKHSQIMMFHIEDKIEGRYFGTEAKLTLAIINNNLKKAKVLGFSGVQEMVCMNHQADGIAKIADKHTKTIMARAFDKIEKWIHRLRKEVVVKTSRRGHLKNYILNESTAHDWLVQASEQNILPITRLLDARDEWKQPTEHHNAPNGSAFLFSQAVNRVIATTPTNLLVKSNRLSAFLDKKTHFDAPEVL